MENEKLFLVTDGFPYIQSSEAAFIIPELVELVKRYNVTIIACCATPGEVLPEFQSKFSGMVKAYLYQPPKGQYLLQVIRLIFAMSDVTFLNEMVQIVKTRKMIIRRVFWTFLNYYWAYDFFQWFKKLGVLKYNEKAIYYTFWNQYYLFAITMKREKYANIRIVSRIHGYDLFQEQSPMKWQPFKPYMDKMTDRTVFIAEHGRKYYERYYSSPDRAYKHVVCRLGILPQKVKMEKRENGFLLVSCSNLYPLKKIDLIIQALGLINEINIEWVHFGKGEEKEKLENLAEKILKPLHNIRYEFKGFLPNEEVLDYYKKNNPSCFITTSLTEGSPVSMQEAIACGIPIIGTNVGGISEMINGNGILLPDCPTIEEIAEAIRKIYYVPDAKYLKMRQISLEIWADKFDRNKNNVEFLNLLEEL